MTRELERFVADACYNLAVEILEGYRAKGFDYEREDDIKEIRKLEDLTNFLRDCDDLRWHELRAEYTGLIKFPTKLRRIK